LSFHCCSSVSLLFVHEVETSLCGYGTARSQHASCFCACGRRWLKPHEHQKLSQRRSFSIGHCYGLRVAVNQIKSTLRAVSNHFNLSISRVWWVRLTNSGPTSGSEAWYHWYGTRLMIPPPPPNLSIDHNASLRLEIYQLVLYCM
jgi:hypothetical protein